MYSTQTPVESLAKGPRTKLTRHYTVYILYRRYNKAVDNDGITTELLRAGDKPVLQVLQKLFNSVIVDGKTPKVWNGSEVVLFFKKGDKTLLKNYRPI